MDWRAVAARAQVLNLPTGIEADLIRALLQDGVTTRGVVGMFCGRGVGSGALESACRECGGEMSIASAPGRGTIVGSRFPATRADEAA